MTKAKKENREKPIENQEKIDFETGEVSVVGLESLNKVIIKETRRPDGTLRIQQDFTNCPTMAEQHTAHLTNINYLIEKYKPDELQAYLNARSQYRQEIVSHDFASEPSLQEARNMVYQSRMAFESLPEMIRNQFRSHLEFLKFADIPSNAQKLIDLRVLSPQQLQSILISDSQLSITPQPQPQTNTQSTQSSPPTSNSQS